jgi:hypothetical protein
MTKTQVIARQAKRIEEMRVRLKAANEAAGRIRTQIYGIGGPLNDNKDGFTKQQMGIFQKISTELEWLRQ